MHLPDFNKREDTMRRVNAVAFLSTVALAFAGLVAPANAQVTAYEGARIIVGDGRKVRAILDAHDAAQGEPS